MSEISLGKKQELFSELIIVLLLYMHSKGYKTRLGDLFRDPRVHGKFGHKTTWSYSADRSVHKLKIALDINLFLDGEFLTKTEDHKEFGEFWEKLHPLCRWGGRLPGGDGNHYSLEHNGYY